MKVGPLRAHEQAVIDRLNEIRNPLGWDPVRREDDGLLFDSTVVPGARMKVMRRGIVYASPPRNIEATVDEGGNA